MSKMYQKAIRWLEDKKAKAQATAELLSDCPEAAEELEAPAVIKWIIQQIEKTNAGE